MNIRKYAPMMFKVIYCWVKFANDTNPSDWSLACDREEWVWSALYKGSILVTGALLLREAGRLLERLEI